MYEPDQRFLHYKGGIYRYLFEARSADDGRPVVVYLHLGPNEPEIWVRDKEEFFSEHEPGKLRFTPILPGIASHLRDGATKQKVLEQAAKKPKRKWTHAFLTELIARWYTRK